MENSDLRTITQCRSCGFKNLESIFSLGDLFVSNFIDGTEKFDFKRYPLELVLCNAKSGGCGLLQLRDTVSNEIMYRNYWYRSGANQTMTSALSEIAQTAGIIRPVNSSDYVIDIGCNDGTLIRAYSIKGLKKIGFEPARNLVPVAELSAFKVINDFFNKEVWEKEFPGKKAKIITAIAMFYDLDNPNKFIADIVHCLDEDGIFIIQMSYLPLMLSQNAFDNICHEHLEYYSLFSLENLLKRHGLEVFDVGLNDVNGGSFRIFIKHQNSGAGIEKNPGADERVRNLRNSENKLGLNDRKVYADFAFRVSDIKTRTLQFIREENSKGKKIYIYGASTKGNTLLQFYGIDSSMVPFAAERSQSKWGKKTIGSLISIISEEQARNDHPDYFLVLPWHFMKEFLNRESQFLARGGKFIIPLPELKVINS
ncbi:MAG: class I SAM-dependent methyltransferase [Patescibacteria group bacterium]